MDHEVGEQSVARRIISSNIFCFPITRFSIGDYKSSDIKVGNGLLGAGVSDGVPRGGLR